MLLLSQKWHSPLVSHEEKCLFSDESCYQAYECHATALKMCSLLVFYVYAKLHAKRVEAERDQLAKEMLSGRTEFRSDGSLNLEPPAFS